MMDNLIITIEPSSKADLEALKAVLARHTPAEIVTDDHAIRIVCAYPALKDVVVGFARIFGFREVADEPTVSRFHPSNEWGEQVEQEP